MWVNGAEANYPISYSHTIEECRAKSHRIISILKQAEPEFTNIRKTKCVQINVMGEPSISA